MLRGAHAQGKKEDSRVVEQGERKGDLARTGKKELALGGITYAKSKGLRE